MADQSSERSASPLDAQVGDQSATVRRSILSDSPTDAGSNSAGTIESDQTVVRAEQGTLPPPPLEQASPAEVAKVLVGAELGHFKLEEMIGGGGMGAVFRAADARLDRTVAVKVIPRVGEDLDLLRRFRNEAQSAAKLDHPNIARVYDVGQENGWHFIVFEYIEGTNLRDLVARDGVLSIEDAIYYARQVAEALEHANARGVVHRDVKPSNVLITPDGQVKLVDMGLARSQHVEMNDDMTASGVTLGTFDYISPEQARDPRKADVRSDLYSLGCTIYYTLVGRPPFPGGSIMQKLMNHGNAAPPNPQMFRTEIPPSLTLIIHKLLAKSPSDRYPRPAFLIADLHHLANQLGIRGTDAGTLPVLPSTNPWPKVIQQHLPWVTVVTMFLLTAVGIQFLPFRNNTFEIPPPPDRTVSAPLVPEASPSTPQETSIAKESTNNPTIESSASVIVVSPDAPTDGKSEVSSIAKALEIAATEPAITTIDLKTDTLQTAALTIPRSGLTIRSADGYRTSVNFIDSNANSMQRSQQINLAGHKVAFENIDINWTVPPNALIDGGAIFRMHGDYRETAKLTGCTVTITNSAQQDDVFVFEVDHSADDNTVEKPTPDTSALAFLQLRNCSFRGQMSLIGMDVATQLDLEWDNGFLAATGYLIESSGADPSNGYTDDIVITSVLSNITVACDAGLARIQLGPSGSVPFRIDHRCSNSIFVCAKNATLFEVYGLEDDLYSIAPKCLSIVGQDNRYDSSSEQSNVIYRASNSDFDSLDFTWADIDSPENWFTDFEEDRRKTISWDNVLPSENPKHQQTYTDFDPAGAETAGFRLPEMPPLATVPKSL